MKIPLFNLKNLSTHRSAVMGAAAIGIILCHAVKFGVAMPDLLKKITDLGDVGVDMFLIASGVGIFFSLKNVEEGKYGLGKWYLRRFLRLFSTYTPIMLPFYLFIFRNSAHPIPTALFNFSTLAYFAERSGLWFTSMLVMLYAFSPLIFRLFKGRKRYISGAVLIGLSVAALAVSTQLDGVISNTLYLFGRSTCFYIGMAIAEDVRNGRKISIFIPLGGIILWLIPELLFSFQANWLLAPSVCMAVCLLSKAKPVSAVLNFFGRISLESYMLNAVLIEFSYMISLPFIPKAGGYLPYLLIVVFGTLIAYGIKKAVSVIPEIK